MAFLNEIAADIHQVMCEDSGFGYDWSVRDGSDGDTCDINTNGRIYTINRGSYDCSSSIITAWSTALEGTQWEGQLWSATYTGNMRSVFTSTGLFEWITDFDLYDVPRGSIFLNEANHTAMSQGNCELSQFSMNEYGGCYGGEVGDQTNNESNIRGVYSYPWDGVLWYVGGDINNGTNNDNNVNDTEDDDDMQCIITEPNGLSCQWWFDGTRLHMLDDPDEAEAVKMVYQAVMGKEMPVVQLGSPDAPWASRFVDAVNHEGPNRDNCSELLSFH